MTELTPAHLLWTSGWDSTFQLLRLLLVHRQPVRPIYLIDDKRSSLQIELRTMERIRELIGQLYPEAAPLLLPTRYARVSELGPDPEIEQAYQRLANGHHLGTQYVWLAKFCRERRLDDVEIGFERERYGAGGLLLDRVVADTSAGGYRVYRLPESEKHTDLGTIFGSYAFPLLDFNKQDMAREVDAYGWRRIMLETWFCHRPVGSEPCAKCHPCLHVINGGLGWRIPLRRRLLGATYRATIGLAKKLARPIVRRLRGALLTPVRDA